MSSLPAVGTIFASIPLLELAAFTAAKNGFFPLRVFSITKGEQARFYCTGKGTPYFARKRGIPLCTCRLYAYKDGRGGYEVKKVVEEHSCNLPRLGSKEALAERETLTKLIREAEQELTNLLEGPEGRENEEDDGEEDSASAKEGEPGPRLSSIRRHSVSSVSSVAVGTSMEGRSPNSGAVAPHPSQKSRFRTSHSKRLLRDDIVSLAKPPPQGKPLDLPDFSTLFPSARALLVHLYAWAEQQHLNLNHSPSSVKRILLWCKPPGQDRRCSFEVVICEIDEGNWHVSTRILQHDSVIHAKSSSIKPSGSRSGTVTSTPEPETGSLSPKSASSSRQKSLKRHPSIEAAFPFAGKK
ncbi:hypothetical protein JCM11251_004476 [Rhodosporidiobolus azoricus]